MMSAILRRTGATVLFTCLLAAGSHTAAQSPSAVAGEPPNATGDAAVFGPNEPARDYKVGKIIRARKITGTPPQIDGRLNEDVWKSVDAVTGFIQRDPDNGKAMTEETRVQVAYDDRYLYIAVTALDSGAVSAGMG